MRSKIKWWNSRERGWRGDVLRKEGGRHYRNSPPPEEIAGFRGWWPKWKGLGKERADGYGVFVRLKDEETERKNGGAAPVTTSTAILATPSGG